MTYKRERVARMAQFDAIVDLEGAGWSVAGTSHADDDPATAVANAVCLILPTSGGGIALRVSSRGALQEVLQALVAAGSSVWPDKPKAKPVAAPTVRRATLPRVRRRR